MAQEQINEGNKIIAEFMGGKFLSEDAFGNGNIKHYTNFNPGSHPNQLIKSSGRKFLTQDLIYHSSWDWLMPVVEKINSITKGENKTPFRVSIFPLTSVIDIHLSIGDFKDISFSGSDIKLNTYNAVIAFIKWNNNQK